MESDHLESKTEPLVPSTKPETVTSDWGKIKNAFWLGHHLTWTMDIILRGGRASDIAYEFLQCGIFIRDLNLLSTSFGQRFVKLNEEAKTILSKELTRADREALIVELSAILNEFNVVATQKISSQGGFTAG